MQSVKRRLFAAAMAAVLCVGPARAQEPAEGTPLRLGQIDVDRETRSFTVRARFIPPPAPDVPMEFLAVPPAAAKSYESMVELAALPSEFNVACLLIGLDPENAVPPLGVFDPTPADGDPVALDLVWQDAEGEMQTAPLTDFIKLGNGDETPTGEWVYIGSYFLPDNAYAADAFQLIIGFSHDPESIIQHASGLGLHQYGAVQLSPRYLELPPVFDLRVAAIGG